MARQCRDGISAHGLRGPTIEQEHKASSSAYASSGAQTKREGCPRRLDGSWMEELDQVFLILRREESWGCREEGRGYFVCVQLEDHKQFPNVDGRMLCAEY